MLNVKKTSMYKSDKILPFPRAKKLIALFKSENKKVGLCHGGFDLLHPGHVKHFESAKQLCDILFVSVTSDNYVSLRKGNGMPIYTDKLRAYMAASIKFVDYVVISDFETAIEVIKILKPEGDIFIKTDHYHYMTTVAEQLINKNFILKINEDDYELSVSGKAKKRLVPSGYETLMIKSDKAIYTLEACRKNGLTNIIS